MTLKALVILLLLPALGWAQPATSSVQDEDLILRFAERLIGGPANLGTTVTLVPGGLPEEMPVDLPPIADALLLGSMTRAEEHGFRSTQVLYDVAAPSDEVMSRLRASLLERGWQARSQHMPGGFMDGSVSLHAEFCPGGSGSGEAESDEAGPDEAGSGEEGPGEMSAVVYVNVSQAEEGLTDLRFDIISDRYGPCANPQAVQEEPYQEVPLPRLHTPEGLSYTYLGNHWSQEDASSNARLQGETSLAGLSEAYGRQLRDQGWQGGETAVQDEAVWSRWILTDESSRRWQGALSFVSARGGDYLASFMMTRLED